MAVITLKTVLPTFIILSTQHQRFAEGCTEPDPSRFGAHSKQQTCCCSGTLALAFFWGKRGADRLTSFVSSKLGRALSFCLAHIPLSPGTPRGGWDLQRFSEKRSPNETPQNQGTGKVTLCFFFSCTNALISLCWSERHKAPEEEGSSPGTRQQRSHNQSRAGLEGEARTWSPTAACSLFLLARLRLLSSAPFSRDLPWFTRSSSDIH